MPPPMLADIASGVRRPGLGSGKLDARPQRAGVPGGASLLIDLAVGDRVTVRDLEGGQSAQVAVFSATGAADINCIEIDQAASRLAVDASALIRCVSADVRAALVRRRAKIETARPFILLGRDAGASVTLVARAACLLVIAAPAHDKPADGIPIAGPLDLAIQRQSNDPTRAAPLPLADARADFLLARRTGQAYQVKAGEYIQLVDIAGRQCSDFIAFPRRALDKGLERFIDTTVTRTMVRGGYPRPGLLDKYFDQDMQPLLQVVQDTLRPPRHLWPRLHAAHL